jgi:hypothetical protein
MKMELLSKQPRPPLSGDDRKPTEFIQNPSELKTVEALSKESRPSEPGCPVRNGDSKKAGFSAEMDN